MCFSPQQRAIFRHRNFKKWSKHAVFCTFWLSNVLFATAACNFSTSELQKVVQTCGVLMCFVHFDFQMCFSPQRRAIFRHLNRQKCSEAVMFCTFWLSNVLFATAANNFFDIWTDKSAPKPLCFVHFYFQNVLFATAACNFWCLLSAPDLRTRRFNRPTFGLTRHTNLWKNTAFRDFSNIWRGCIFFLLTFWLLHLLSTDLTTLLLLFNSPYCRKFLFKLPSIIYIYICIDRYLLDKMHINKKTTHFLRSWAERGFGDPTLESQSGTAWLSHSDLERRGGLLGDWNHDETLLKTSWNHVWHSKKNLGKDFIYLVDE